MPTKWIWIKNQRYYLYETYNTYQEARKWANSHRKKNGCRWFIQKYDVMTINPFRKYKYALYLNKSIGLW